MQRQLIRIATCRSCVSTYTTRSIQQKYQQLSFSSMYSTATKLVPQQQRMCVASSSILQHSKQNSCSCARCCKVHRVSFSTALTTEGEEPLLGVGKYKTSTGLVSFKILNILFIKVSKK
jgi:hypothetical protein